MRPFSFAAVQDGRIWFCTATTKDVYRELEANPKFELTAWKPGSGWVIMRGKAVLKDEANEDVRRAGYEHMTGLGESYEGPGDETLTFFTVIEPDAWLCEHRRVAGTPSISNAYGVHSPSKSRPTVVSRPPAMRSSMSTVGFAFPLSISMRYLRLTPTMRAKEVCDTLASERSLAILVPS